MPNIKEYQTYAVDWREQIRINQRRTFFVVIVFIALYLALGILFDLYRVAIPQQQLNTTSYSVTNESSSSSYSNLDQTNEEIGLYSPHWPNLDPKEAPQGDISTGTTMPLDQALVKLVTFQVLPLATLIMLGIALLSLIITYTFHQKISMLGTEYTEVTADTKSPLKDKQFYNVIEELKIAAGMKYMPKVCIIEAEYMNAMATGMSERSSMVAITRGLLDKLDRSELQAVMAHELSHIRHADIKLTMTVAILSNLMLIAVDFIFRGIMFGGSRNRDNRLVTLIIALRFLLPILTLLLVMYLSRRRELMADSGSVEITRDNEPLARALLKIDSDHKQNAERYGQLYRSTPHEEVRQDAYFYDPTYAGIDTIRSINNLFASHPSLEERLAALGFKLRKRRSE